MFTKPSQNFWQHFAPTVCSLRTRKEEMLVDGDRRFVARLLPLLIFVTDGASSAKQPSRIRLNVEFKRRVCDCGRGSWQASERVESKSVRARRLQLLRSTNRILRRRFSSSTRSRSTPPQCAR